MTRLLIVARGGPDAKTRCAEVLTGAERAELARAMLADMLEAAARTPGLSGVSVSTPTCELAALATKAGADVITEPPGLGLNDAFGGACRRIARSEPSALLALLPGDLPLLEPRELANLIAGWRTGEVLLVAAAADGGTGAIVLPAGAPFAFAYGLGSLAHHVEAARGAGLSPRLVEAPSLAFDLDRPSDIATVLAAQNGGRTKALLAASARSSQAAA